MKHTDSEFVARVRAGNKEAFGQLIERHQARALRVARGIVANEDAAEELVQEAMLRAYLSLDRLREGDRFASWLHGIVLNVCRHYLRDRKRDALPWETLEREPVVSMRVALNPEVIAEQRERERMMLDAVNALSPENRDATLLFYYEQLSLQEVALALDISVGAVKGRLYQARKQLRERLLPLYPESATAMPKRPRRRKMIQISIVPKPDSPLDGEDPLTAEAQARHFLLKLIMSQSPQHAREWVGLWDAAAQRFLPIQLGWSPNSVAAVLNRESADVSPAIALMSSLLKATDAAVEAVRIEPLNDEIWHGVIQLRRAAGDREVAARPGDAIALAVQTSAPISVTESILAAASWDLSDALPVAERLQQTADTVSLRRAAEEPFLVRVARAVLEYGIRSIEPPMGHSIVEFVRQHRGVQHLAMFLHSGDNSCYGSSLPISQEALSALIACFKRMANLDLAEQQAPQRGHASVEHKGKSYDVEVSTEPTPLGETPSLRLERKEAPGPAA